MSYKSYADLLRIPLNQKWIINIAPNIYSNLGLAIQIKYFILNSLEKKKFLILSFKKTLHGNNYIVYIYYYKYQHRSKSIWFDKLLKKKLERDLNKFFNVSIKLNINNVTNYLPLKVNNVSAKVKKVIWQPRKKYIKDLINVINICTYAVSSKILSHFLLKVLCSLKRHWAFIKITFNILTKVLYFRNHKISGVQIAVQGKINGRGRKKTVLKHFGKIAKPNLTKCVKYSLSTDYNVYGAFSLKIWFTKI